MTHNSNTIKTCFIAALVVLFVCLVDNAVGFACTESDLNNALGSTDGTIATFDCEGVPTTITLTSMKTIHINITLDGSNLLTIKGAPSPSTFNLFSVSSSHITVTFMGMTLLPTNGNGALETSGAIVQVTSSAATIQFIQCRLIFSVYIGYGILFLSSSGSVNFDSCFVSDSSTSGPGSGVVGVLIGDVDINVISSTFTAPNAGSGFTYSHSATGTASGIVSIGYSTMAYYPGGAFVNFGTGSAVSLYMNNSIFAYGGDAFGVQEPFSVQPNSIVVSEGNNIFYNPLYSPPGSLTFTDQDGLDPHLISPPQLINGGYCEVFALNPCSSAINAGAAAGAPATDETGSQRITLSSPDVGAYESVLYPCLSVTRTITVTAPTVGSKTITPNITLGTLYSPLPISVGYATVDGTAVAGKEYVFTNGTAMFVNRTNSGTVSINIIGTSVYNLQKTFTLQLSGPVNAVTTGPPTTITILNPNSIPIITLQPLGAAYNEGTGSFVTFTVTLSGQTAFTVSVKIAFTGTAVNNTNYLPTTTTVSFPPLNTTATFTVNLLYNAVCEGTKTVIATISSPTNGVVGSQNSTSFTILDIDQCNVTLPVQGITVKEDSGLLVLPFSLNLPSAWPSSFTFSLVGESTLFQTITTSPVMLSALQTSGNITVNITQDLIHQPTQQLTLTLTSFSSIYGGSILVEYINILDVDPVPTVSIHSVVSTASESASSPVLVTVQLSGKTSDEVNVTFAYNGTAFPSNLASPLLQRISFPPLETLIPVGIQLQDNFVCGATSLGFSISAASAADILDGSSELSFLILDTDLCNVTLAAQSIQVTEGSGQLLIPFSVNLPSASDSSFAFSISGSSSLFEIITTSPVTIPALQTTGNISVNITHDLIHHPTPQQLTLTLSNLNGVLGGSVLQEVINVTDIDLAPSVSIQSSISQTSEGAPTPIIITLQLNGMTSQDLNFTLSYNGSAVQSPSNTNNIAGGLASLPQFVAFPALQTVVSFSISLVQNFACGGTTLNVWISGSTPFGASTLATSYVSVAISDIDVCNVTLLADSITVNEGSGVLPVPFSLNNPLSSNSSFTFSITGPSDIFAQLTTSPVVIPAFAVSGYIDVNITRNYIFQTTQQLVLALGNFNTVSAGSVLQENIYVTNVDDVPTVSIKATVGQVREDTNTPILVTVRLSGEAAQGVNVSFSYSGTAFPSNVLAPVLSLSFSSFQTVSYLNITLVQNFVCGDTALNFSISAAYGATILAGSSLISVMIQNVDLCYLTLATTNITVNEGSGNLVIPYSVNLPSFGDSWFSFNVSGVGSGGASSPLGPIFQVISSSPVYIAGLQTSGNISLLITHDFIHQATQQLLLTIASLNNILSGSILQEYINVIDIDPIPTVSLQSSTTHTGESTTTPIVLTLQLSGMTADVVTVALQSNGSALLNNIVGGSVVNSVSFASLQTTTSSNITLERNFICGNTTLNIWITTSSGAVISTNASSLSIAIADVDKCLLSFVAGSVTVNEGTGLLFLPYNLSYPSSTLSSFNVTTSSLTNIYSPVLGYTFQLPIPALQTTGNIVLNITHDSVHRAVSPANISVVLGVLTGTISGGQYTSEVVFVTDVDPSPVVSVSAPASIFENSTKPLTLTLSLSVVTDVPVHVILSFNGTYNFSNNLLSGGLPQELIFQPLQAVATFSIYVQQNHVFGDQTLYIQVTYTSPAYVAASNQTTVVQILDVDCTPASCNQHSTCRGTVGPSCICNVGFQEPSCSQCLPSYYGSNCSYCDEDTSCSGRGTCSPNNGTCLCDTGYVGDSCSIICSSVVSCNSHGSCSKAGTCVCDPAYSGSSCSVCSTDHYSYPACIHCDASVDCSAHGSCNSAAGCSCASNFTGSACSQCATGFSIYPKCQDINECADGSNNCSQFGFCTNTVGSFLCTCNSGYAGDGVQCTSIDGSLFVSMITGHSAVATWKVAPQLEHALYYTLYSSPSSSRRSVDEIILQYNGTGMNSSMTGLTPQSKYTAQLSIYLNNGMDQNQLALSLVSFLFTTSSDTTDAPAVIQTSSGLPGASIAAIVIGVFVALLLIVILIFFLLTKKKKEKIPAPPRANFVTEVEVVGLYDQIDNTNL